jgi:Predicted membrane protein (DUF2085)
MNRVLGWAFVIGAVLWAVALPLAAAAAATPGGTAGAYGAAALAYAMGSLICHQQAGRSFHLWGVQLPVCARCTGIYVGAALAAIALGGSQTGALSAVPGRRFLDHDRQRAALVVSAVPIAVTLVFEWTSGITPSNAIRALSGLPLGAVVASVVLAACRSHRAPARMR